MTVLSPLLAWMELEMWKSLSGICLAVLMCSSVVANEIPQNSDVFIQCRGRLRHGLVAVGGETTGTTITFNKIVWELQLKDDAQRRFATDHHKKQVVVAGTLRKVAGVEVRNRWIVDVREISEARRSRSVNGSATEIGQVTIRGKLQASTRRSDSGSMTIAADGQTWPITFPAQSQLKRTARSVVGQTVVLKGSVEKVSQDRSAAPLIRVTALKPATASAKKKPNVILVMADDQGWGDTGYNRHPVLKTPNLDAMAREAFVFNRFYAAAPVCSPTRGSVLTGRHPFRIKITNHGRYMRPQEVTIAEELKAAGYTTGMFGKWHVGSAQADSPVCPGNSGFDEWCIGLNFFDNNPYLSRNGNVERFRGRGTDITIDETVSFLRKHADGEKPLLAVVWFPSPHDPHLEKPDQTGMYAGDKRAGYWDEITLLDSAFGRLRRAVDSLGMKDNTILWYCSDNGGLDRKTSGGRDRKGSIYEGGLRVPSMVQWPGKIKSGSTDVPGNTSDILPTILAMAAVPRSGSFQLDGIDLSDIIAGKSWRHPAMGFWHGFQQGQATWSDRILKDIMDSQKTGGPNPHQQRLRKDIDEFPQFATDSLPGHAALLDWPWKLHRIENQRTVKYELYNLTSSPMEDVDLSGHRAHVRRMQRMKQQLQEWQVSVIGSLNGKDYGTASGRR